MSATTATQPPYQQIPAVIPLSRSVSASPSEQKPIVQAPASPISAEHGKGDQNGTSPVAGAQEPIGLFTMAMLPFLVFVILLMIVLLIISWCTYNVSVDSNAKQVESNKKYQAFGLSFLLILAIGAPLGYFLWKMCQNPESNVAVIWAIATVVPLVILAVLSWVVQWSLGTYYYLIKYVMTSEDSRNKELLAIRESLSKKNTSSGTNAGTTTGGANIPSTNPAAPTGDATGGGRHFVSDIRGGRRSDHGENFF